MCVIVSHADMGFIYLSYVPHRLDVDVHPAISQACFCLLTSRGLQAIA